MTSKRLLIVDDSPTVRKLLAFHLKRIPNVSIQQAEHGVDALAKLEETAYDLLVVDINMPVLDGLKLVSAVRSNERTKDIPIVIATTRGQDVDRKKAMDLGADAYIVKPVNGTNLIDITTRLLAG